MKSQYLKDLYFLFSYKITVFSFYWNKFKYSFYVPPHLLIHIGCDKKYIKGMINIDSNIFRKTDMWLDVRIGLPFPNNSVTAIYASHIIEHFNVDNIKKIFSEFYRVLKPDGAIRIVVPSLEYAIRSYVEANVSNFPTWPVNCKSIGGRFNNFLLCSNQHFTMLDFSFLEELLTESGFYRISRQKTHSSSYFREDHMQFESTDQLNDSSLYVECCK